MKKLMLSLLLIASSIIIHAQPKVFKSHSAMLEVCEYDENNERKCTFSGILKKDKRSVFIFYKDHVEWLRGDRTEKRTEIYYIDKVDKTKTNMISYMVKDVNGEKYVMNLALNGRTMAMLGTNATVTFFGEE